MTRTCRVSCVVASFSLFHLTNSSNRHDGITECIKAAKHEFGGATFRITTTQNVNNF
jgi:hypothetical protein